MSLPLWLPFVLGLAGQAPAPAPRTSQVLEAPEEPAARLEFMRKSLKAYDIRPVDGRGPAYKLRAEPALRFTNTVGDTRDGAIFLWLDEHDRPVVSVQVFFVGPRGWWHELSSLSPGRLIGKTPSPPDWTPAKPGVEFRPVPGAPKPADTADLRLRQMRDLTRDFIAEDDFKRKSFQKLRLLSKPFARYGKPDSDVIDGALFAFVLTTDPEVYLMLEARTGKDGPEWQYAFAPSTTYPVRGKVKGLEVWKLPYRFDTNHPAEPFFVRPIRVGE